MSNYLYHHQWILIISGLALGWWIGTFSVIGRRGADNEKEGK